MWQDIGCFYFVLVWILFGGLLILLYMFNVDNEIWKNLANIFSDL